MAKSKAKIIYQENKKKKLNILPILITSVAIIAVGIIIALIATGKIHFGGGNSESDLLVLVNGEPIYTSQLDKNWDILPLEVQMKMTREQLLDEMIKEVLLLQEAQKNNISVSDAEVDLYISNQLVQSGMTMEQFESALAQEGIDPQDMKETYKRQLTVAALFESQADINLTVTDAEIETYYEEHKEEFYQAQKVQVRHILTPINEQLNETTAQERTDMLVNEIAEGADFCALVTNYSADPGSVDTCGEYTFARGVMVEAFENTSFDMNVNDVEVVKTSFGYHIIQKLADIPAGYIGVNEEIAELGNGVTTADVIRQLLGEQKAAEIFNEYVEELLAGSTITHPQEDVTSEDVEINTSEDIVLENTAETEFVNETA